MSETNVWPSVVNLANSIVGVSVLAMPYCFKQCGIVLGPLVLLLAGYLTRKSCHFLVKAGNVAKRRSYEFLALHSFGAGGKLAVELCTIGLMLATCVGFFVIIGDLTPVIVSKILNIPNSSSLRATILVVTAFGVALPLGMLRKISSLTSVSSLSFCFYFTLVLFLVFQALPNLFSGEWASGPQRIPFWRPAGVLKCFPIFGLAFACQTQLFPIYETMSDPSLKKMVQVINSAMNIVAAIYLSVGFFGLVSYYDVNVVGDILLSFRPSIFGEAIKLGFVLSVAGSFPLVIFPCRLSINSLIWPPSKKGLGDVSTDNVEVVGATYIPPFRFKAITLGIIISTLFVGINVPGIEAILGLVGATVGVFISFIFPPLLYLVVTSLTHGERSEKMLGKVVFVTGVAIMLSSAYLNLTDRRETVPASPDLTKQHHHPLPLPLGDLRNLPKASEPPVEIRHEPPIPHEPDDAGKPKSPKESEDKAAEAKAAEAKVAEAQAAEAKAAEAKIASAAAASGAAASAKEAALPEAKDFGLDSEKKVADKEDYDALQRKIDAAEEKHDVLLQQLVQQQEQQKIIMQQQNQIIQELKANKENQKQEKPVEEKLLKTEEKIAKANEILNKVAKETKIPIIEAAAPMKKETNEIKEKEEIRQERSADLRKVDEVAKNEAAVDQQANPEDPIQKKMVAAAQEASERVAAAAKLAAAKLAAEAAAKKEADAKQAAEEAIRKEFAAKEAAMEAVAREAVAKEAEKKLEKNKDATPAPLVGVKADAKAAAAAAANTAGKAANPAEKSVLKSPEEKLKEQVKKKVGEQKTSQVDEKEVLKKRLENHEKLIVQMHQKIEEIEKVGVKPKLDVEAIPKVDAKPKVDTEAKPKEDVEAQPKLDVEVDLGTGNKVEKLDEGAGKNGNPKPLGLSSGGDGVEKQDKKELVKNNIEGNKDL